MAVSANNYASTRRSAEELGRVLAIGDEGRDNPIHIAIPKGSYVPIIQARNIKSYFWDEAVSNYGTHPGFCLGYNRTMIVSCADCQQTR